MKLRIQKADGKLLVSKIDDEGYIQCLVEFSRPLHPPAAEVVLSSFEINPERKDVEIENFITNDSLNLIDNLVLCSRMVFNQRHNFGVM